MSGSLGQRDDRIVPCYGRRMTRLSSPEPSGDLLTDVIARTGLTGGLFCRSELTAPWGIAFPAGQAAAFHVVGRGTCWLRAGALRPRHVGQGDVLLMPSGIGHALASEPDVSPVPLSTLLAEKRVGDGKLVRAGGGGVPSVLYCGAYRFDSEGPHPILSLLPPVIHVPAEDGRLAGPLEATLGLLTHEFVAGEPGSAALVGRLVDVLFVQVLRAWLARQPEGRAGWLGALRDPQIGRALALVHADPAADWGLERLARSVAMSRAAFARRFRELVRESPLRYVARCRMDLAARLLRETDEPLPAVAAAAGYESEFAFSKAFRRSRGVPPGRFRDARRASA